MKKSLVAAVISIFTCGATQAGMNIEAISLELSKAASSHDLAAARELSSKQIDGSMFRLKAEPVEIGYDEFEPAESEELELSEPKKLVLKADVAGLKIKDVQKKDSVFSNLSKKIYHKLERVVYDNKNSFSEHIGSRIKGGVVNNEDGFFKHMKKTMAMPLALPVVFAVKCAQVGPSFGKYWKIPVMGLGVVSGLILGAVSTPAFMISEISLGLIDLFKGNL